MHEHRLWVRSVSLKPKDIENLHKWFSQSARSLPWRKEPYDPYAIWISEVMSQQSTMPTVLPYFDRWMKSFPSVESLASASEDRVLAAWAGLGYYSRARNVHKAAQEIVLYKKSEGTFPQSRERWLGLPGVGPYTASAIMAIAFDAPHLPLDGNVFRVMSRFLGVPDPLNSSRDRESIEQSLAQVEALLKTGGARILSQALMELGALVCRPGALAQCEICPLRDRCQARKRDCVAKWPLKKTLPQVEKVWACATLYFNSQGEILLRQIPKGRRLEGQWELPWDSFAQNEVDEIINKFESFGPVRHSITKYRYEVWGLKMGSWTGALPSGHRFWRAGDRAFSGTLTTLSKKLLKQADLF